MLSSITNTQAIVLTLGLILVWMLPYVTDLLATYVRAGKIRNNVIMPLIKGKTISDISEDQLKELFRLAAKEPIGVRGVVRALLGLTVLSLVGVALFFTFTSDTEADLRKTIVTAMLAILGTIAGFYFGSKATQEAGAASLQAVLSPPPVPTITSVEFDLSSIRGGQPAKLTVALSSPAPATGCVVELTSDSTKLPLPTTLSFTAGTSSQTVAVQTQQVAAAETVTITARVSGAQAAKTATVTLTP